jgi:hypothetical protein
MDVITFILGIAAIVAAIAAIPTERPIRKSAVGLCIVLAIIAGVIFANSRPSSVTTQPNARGLGAFGVAGPGYPGYAG